MAVKEVAKELRDAKTTLVDQKEHFLVKGNRTVAEHLKSSTTEHARKQSEAARKIVETEVLRLTENVQTNEAKASW